MIVGLETETQRGFEEGRNPVVLVLENAVVRWRIYLQFELLISWGKNAIITDQQHVDAFEFEFEEE